VADAPEVVSFAQDLAANPHAPRKSAGMVIRGAAAVAGARG